MSLVRPFILFRPRIRYGINSNRNPVSPRYSWISTFVGMVIKRSNEVLETLHVDNNNKVGNAGSDSRHDLPFAASAIARSRSDW